MLDKPAGIYSPCDLNWSVARISSPVMLALDAPCPALSMITSWGVF